MAKDGKENVITTCEVCDATSTVLNGLVLTCEGGVLKERQIIAWPKANRLNLLRQLARENGRTVLLLQGPVGTFFNDVSAALQKSGYLPLKINLNSADWLFSRKSPHINYTGTPEDWSDWLEQLLGFVKPAAIMLMGDSRPMHRAAIQLASEKKIPVFCFEEGYVRPDFITMEPGGVNANSPARQLVRDYSGRQKIEALAFKDTPHHRAYGGNAFFSMAGAAAIYFIAMGLGKPFFRHYVHHRRRPLVTEFFLWNRSILLKAWRHRENGRLVKDLIKNHHRKYFVLALQVSDDLQLTVHGRGWTNEKTISQTIASFARHALPDDRLVIKGHPQDRGHTTHKSYVKQIAVLAGCEDRVDYVDDGSIGLLLNHSKGLITINSTAGISALFHNVPILAFGDALYSAPGLAQQVGGPEDIDQFWLQAQPADQQLASGFLIWLRENALINGSFYVRQVRKDAALAVVSRFKDALSKPAEIRTLPAAAPKDRQDPADPGARQASGGQG